MLSRIALLVARIGHGRARYMLLAGGLALGMTLAVAIALFLFAQRQPVIDDAIREMRNDALLLAEEEDSLLQSIDLVQVHLVESIHDMGIETPDDLKRHAATEPMHHSLRDRIVGLPQVASLAISNRQGGLVNTSLVWPTPSINDDDRSVFVQVLASGGEAQPSISVPWRSRVTGQWMIFLSRRLTATNGQVIGFVHSAVDVGYFERYCARLPLTGGGSFGLMRFDGTLLARYPPIDPDIGRSYIDHPNFMRILGALNVGVVRQVSMLDGKDRLMVPYALPHFPLLITVSDTMNSILMPWRAQSRSLIVVTALMELILGLTVLLAVRHLHGYELLQAAQAELAVVAERDRAAQALQQQEHRFDAALHNMHQGLLMFSHVGELLVVNRQFHELFGMPDGSLPPGISYDELVDRVVRLGNVSADDMRGVRERRKALLDQNKRATAIWELSDSRAFNVTHQPMEEGWLTTFEEVTERRKAEERMVYLAQHDALTGLPNRVLFRDKLSEGLAFARRGYGLALLCLDLDRFKGVNDTLGHPVGDTLLQMVARRLSAAARDTDTVARLGGDEFAIVQRTISRPSDATTFASRLLDLLAEPFDVDGHRIVLTTSIGIALSPQDSVDADQLLRGADLALYRAKADGRGVYRLFQAEMDRQMQMRRLLELDLRQALQENQLELFYQPQVDMSSRCVTAVEALLRWHHPERGSVSPADFIPLAEEIGLIVPIGAWALRTACTMVASWPGTLRVAVNISAAQLTGQDLVAEVKKALRDSSLPADRLELEITESVMLNDTIATLATLHRLRDLGVRIALDDFGTGYSSLSYLRRFPFDRIKIDQSFVREMSSQPDSGAIVRAIAGLSRELGMATTAEGVETQDQLDLLVAAGCNDIQGFLFSRAVPATSIAEVCAAIAEMLRQPAANCPTEVARQPLLA
jgi:diguanylate cyclase (GGDEF)-like protein